MSFIFCAIFFLFLVILSFFFHYHTSLYVKRLLCEILPSSLLHPCHVEWVLFFAYLSRKLWYEIMPKTFIDGIWSESILGCDIYCLRQKGIVQKYVDIDICRLNRNRSFALAWNYIEFKPIICPDITWHCIENSKDVYDYLLHHNFKTIHEFWKEDQQQREKWI